jgi:hypothetical protein
MAETLVWHPRKFTWLIPTPSDMSTAFELLVWFSAENLVFEFHSIKSMIIQKLVFVVEVKFNLSCVCGTISTVFRRFILVFPYLQLCTGTIEIHRNKQR